MTFSSRRLPMNGSRFVFRRPLLARTIAKQPRHKDGAETSEVIIFIANALFFSSVHSSPCDPNFTFKVTKAKHDKTQWKCEKKWMKFRNRLAPLSSLRFVSMSSRALFYMKINACRRKGSTGLSSCSAAGNTRLRQPWTSPREQRKKWFLTKHNLNNVYTCFDH